MARTLKTAGSAELRALLRRTHRQKALGRIGQDDCDYIVSRLLEVEARITSMRELNEQGEEDGDG